jgi:hypothetical protein
MLPVQIDARSLSTESSGAAHAAERAAKMIDDSGRFCLTTLRRQSSSDEVSRCDQALNTLSQSVVDDNEANAKIVDEEGVRGSCGVWRGRKTSVL